jgi:YVTN family beta-propeller protein
MLRLPNVFRSALAQETATNPARAIRTLLLTLIAGFGALSPTAAQVAGNVAPQPVIVYVANAAGGITEINSSNNSAIATAPFPNNGSTLAVTPDGTRLYVSNRDVGEVRVFDTRTNVPLVVIPVGNAGENVGIAVSPNGQLVYVANQFSGTVTVIDAATNHVVQTIFTGAEPIWITFSADGSGAYVSNQVSGTVSVVATASGSVINTIGGFSCPFHSKLTHDGSKLLVSSQCDNSLKVVNLSTNTVVNSIPTGPNPRGIALTPDGRRAYVADWFSNTVDVIDVVAEVNLNTPITVGNNPLGIAMTPSGKAYVANFSDNSISVIESSTNTVTATLPARVLPQDVIVSTTAEPRILNYSFLSLDPPGSVNTVSQAVNGHGEIVGQFQDSAGLVHGYLRQGDGSFVTIDPPGSILTDAFGINDAGTIVGIWQAQGGAFHGFIRSASGVYTTSDFPGSVDSEFTAINSQGTTVGVYDLGILTTNISFVDVRGVFTSFEDPAAAPLETAATGINSANFVSGIFDDPAGNEHSFVRSANAQFHNFDFPLADFTDAYKLNDSGDLVGQYATNFPNHGFVFSGATDLTGPPSPCQFLSFDYPDSGNSGARGINNLGQITGFYRLRGAPGRHGFLATPTPGRNGKQGNACQETANFSTRHGASFKSFDYPGSTNTQATAITPSGEIVGRYNSSDGRQHGFVLRDDVFSSVDVPGATFTYAAWVNARGDIVGGYGDSRGGHAYVLRGGTFTTIDFPSASAVCTAGFGISNVGDVVGVEFPCNDFIHGHGYLFSRGRFTLIDVPGAVGTFPTMVIDSTRIVGTYFGTDGVFHGFLWQAGNFTTIDVPNSTFTWITGINPGGAIVGFYNSKDGNQHGFVLSDGEFITVDVPVPGATFSEVNGIDPQGDGVGRYITPDGHTHGYFLRCVTCTRHDPTGLPGSTQ